MMCEWIAYGCYSADAERKFLSPSNFSDAVWKIHSGGHACENPFI